LELHTGFSLQLNNLYYWFRVGEGTLQIHHLTSNFTPD
jgi:hypothetical protein